MSQTLWMVERELREQKLVFAAALLVGLTALASPLLLPQLRSWGAYETMNATAGSLAVAFAVCVAILSGTSVLGRELAERRLGFYFMRPLTWSAIWGGKMLAAFLLAVLSGLLVALPVILVGGGLPELFLERIEPLANAPLFAVVIALIVTLVAVSHVLSVALRARSNWVLLMVLALPPLILFLGLTLWSFKRDGAEKLFVITTAIIVIAVVLALLVAGAVGMATGRSEILNVHRGTAISLVASLAVLAATLAGYAHWVHSASVDDLDRVQAGDPLGQWVPVLGLSRGRVDYPSMFLVNAETGESRSIREGVSDISGGGPAKSADGSRAGLIDVTSTSPFEAEVVLLELGQHAQLKRTRVSVRSKETSGPYFSDDGARFALIEHLPSASSPGSMVTVFDVTSERSLASVRVPREKGETLQLLSFSSNRMRFHASGPQSNQQGRGRRIRILELDLISKRVTTTGSFDARWAIRNDDGTRMIARLDNPREFRVLDARNGALISSMTEAAGEELRCRFVASGIAVTVRQNGHNRLDLYDHAMQRRRSFDLGKGEPVRPGYEAAPGMLILLTLDQQGQGFQHVSAIVDLDSGAVRTLDPSLRPLWTFFTQPLPGSMATKIFTSNNRVLYFDPISGEQRVLAGKKPYRLASGARAKE